MPKFHLDCGNSAEGPIGLCGVIEAASAEAALARFRELLPEELEIRHLLMEDSEDVEYVNVYISPENIKITELDEEE